MRAIELNEKADPNVWHQLGRIDFLEGRFSEAIYKFNKQIEYFGEAIPNVHYMLGLTYGYRARETEDVNDWRHAEEEFRKFLDFNPYDPWAHVDLSWVLFSEGKYEEMKILLEEVTDRYPDNPWVLNMYGLALLNTGEREAAHDHFTRALEEADKLTVEDWGNSYPGNDPGSWPKGLSEMKRAIRHNLDTSSS
jgi:tetratricopeptide (TPR) repeat protein